MLEANNTPPVEMDTTMDFEEPQVVATPDMLKKISDLAKRQIEIEEYIAKCEANIKTAKENLKYVSETLLPNALTEVGMAAFSLDNGMSVEVKKELYCTVPKERFGECESWLREHGHESIIKHQIALQFGKGEDDRALEAAQILVEGGFTPQDTKTIHPQTLKAFIREQLGQGVDIPLATFGAYEATKTKIIYPK